ncbi:MAG: ribonuclease Z [Ignavibacteriae bacterium]|nr:ribonuclease Z [Ignavibacteriota bacterium]MCB9209995.1 ribonuclease Z [Ignavibacteriales bacterium]MCB9218620.1 ribonuclease Z [Ignavibacteriales bacterium]MCB9259374.1 ribonuclease Z [Ignavibacteriales bacterium]
MKKYNQKYPLIWKKKNFYIKIYCSIPNIATGIIITTEKSTIVVDPGDGILRDLNKDYSAKEILAISDIFISHGHHDHVGGVWSLLTYLSVMKKSTPLNIYYPKGCLEIESIYKAFHNVYSHELKYKINLKEIDNSRTFLKKDLKIKPFKVNHREPSDDGKESIEVPSLGFKFEHNGKSICYGGDTAYCDALVNMAKGSDLAIIEAGAENENESDLHLTIEQASKIGRTAKQHFLVHVPE